jgi:hypothetical protein
LRCAFLGYENPAPGWGIAANGLYGYYVPVFFDFQATGGSGTYHFTESQNVTNSGTITYSNGRSVNGSQLRNNRLDGPLSNQSADGLPNAAYFDAPGLAWFAPVIGGSTLGAIISAYFTWDFTLQVSVSDGQRQVDCPRVSWSVTELWTPAVPDNTRPLVTSTLTVRTPPTP